MKSERARAWGGGELGAMKGMWDVMGNCSTHHCSLKLHSLYISIDGEHAMNISSRYMPAIWNKSRVRDFLACIYNEKIGSKRIASFFFVAGQAGWLARVKDEKEWNYFLSNDDDARLLLSLSRRERWRERRDDLIEKNTTPGSAVNNISSTLTHSYCSRQKWYYFQRLSFSEKASLNIIHIKACCFESKNNFSLWLAACVRSVIFFLFPPFFGRRVITQSLW